VAIKFIPHPDIALKPSLYDPAVHTTFYRYDYTAIFARIAQEPIATRESYAKSVMREVILKDLFFILLFVQGIEKANKPFVVKQCNMVQDGPQSDTLDVWARAHYKAIDVNEPVLTTEGWTTHGALRPGDYVFAPDGRPIKVLAKTPVFTDAPCCRVTFNDKYSVICSTNHLWRTLRKVRHRVRGTNKRKLEYVPEVVYARRLLPGNDVGIASPLQYPNATLPIPPYTFGAWLGDGASAGGQITNGYHDTELLKFIRAEGVVVNEVKSSNEGSGQYSLDAGIRGKMNTGMTPILRKMGVKNNKHIPDNYKQASIEQRMELLRGLMDTDGHNDGRGTATFCNKSEKLSKDVYEIATGLGFRPNIRQHKCKVNGEDYPFYQVSFQAYCDNPPFKLTRKVLMCSMGKRCGSRHRLVKSVKRTYNRPVSCIQVDSSDGLYLIGRQLVPTHNSAIITTAETLQYHLRNPEECTGILAYARPAAKKFLRSIKTLCEQSITLKRCFPDVLWENPEVQSPKWSEDDGIIFKRKSASRGESTIEAWGLTEGMPTGRHYERVVVDDAETEDIANSPKMLADVFSKFEMAIYNLGTGADTDKRRAIGTYYSHLGPIKKIGDMKFDDGRPMWNLRVVPATDNGKIDGNPVLLDPETWERTKKNRHVNSQQLCDPTPEGDMLLDYTMLQPIEPEFLPKGRFKFMIVDQAGGTDTNVNTNKGDLWSIGIVSIVPATENKELDNDDLGISDVYLEDLTADQMTHGEAIDTIIRMYLRNGMIMQFGVEKVGLSTTEIHVAEALKKKGRVLSVDHGNLVLLRPANRSLEERIKAALQWPLNNSKLWYSTAIAPIYRDKLIEEVKNFPMYHADILNMWAYAYDLFVDFKFEHHRPRVVRSVTQIMAQGPVRNEWGR